ncbi:MULTISPECIES: alpha/beta fold hydrolase [Actinoalloteichus]|uniref:Hydrolase or acyltransferase of alpha/beta superfamily n=1 Tax=Actinoalloteichus fjordicus TaxID=1612552 RepID=A0AAC9LH52_9PSEU|nr:MULTISPECIES: alpha/beta hydrolase [Actinoalloteichus]APU17231.1 putative hydrolase or acyltransferase of alpha/beta superfamily [Actinoalloteichus fjordicus]APU23314.1 putative hydrolase or acyltransferase of alpha/beta superfamily [Actinoalloteichus sp. GBA129-24]
MTILPHDVHGDGPQRVIALHGWFSDRTAFRSIRPLLDTTRFSYAFVDVRGYGEASELAGEYTMAEIASDVLALADHLGWSEFSLLGHSMGGKAAAAVLAADASRVTGIVGISPVPASGVPFDDQAWQLFTGAAENADNRRAIIDLTTGNRHTGVWLDAMVRHSLAASSVSAFASYLLDWARHDFHETVLGDPTPILVIAGEHDPALSADVLRGTWLAWHPHARVEVFGNAGHYAADETPIALVSAVESFLTRQEADRPMAAG